MKTAIVLQKKFIGMDDLRRQLGKILEKLPKEKELIITHHGKPQGILIDVQTYLTMQELKEQIADSDPKFIKKMNTAWEDAQKPGHTIDIHKAFDKLGI
jgi:prevent-host-death family protein